jgi:hypothetical protein
MLVVKMDPALESEVEALAKQTGLSKSEFARQALRAEISRVKSGRRTASAYELGADLFGADKSKVKVSARNATAYIRRKLNARHSR